jgi:hypothetical protein
MNHETAANSLNMKPTLHQCDRLLKMTGENLSINAANAGISL